MTRIIILLLAAAVTGGVAMEASAPAMAQTPAEPTPSAQAAEPAPSAQPAPSPPKRPAPPTKPSAGCTWLGVRTVQALMRDDLVAASDFQRLYQSFGCPQQQLRVTLDCVVKYGTPISSGQVQELVNACWERPAQPVIPAPGPQRLDKPQPEKPKTDKK